MQWCLQLLQIQDGREQARSLTLFGFGLGKSEQNSKRNAHLPAKNN
jgi:hypothetical protein